MSEADSHRAWLTVIRAAEFTQPSPHRSPVPDTHKAVTGTEARAAADRVLHKK